MVEKGDQNHCFSLSQCIRILLSHIASAIQARKKEGLVESTAAQNSAPGCGGGDGGHWLRRLPKSIRPMHGEDRPVRGWLESPWPVSLNTRRCGHGCSGERGHWKHLDTA